MKKIFIDIGGHEGQSAQAALDPSLAFDEVHSFEPHPTYAAMIRRIDDPRLTVHEAALSGSDGTLTLAGDNAHGGATSVARDASLPTITVHSIDVIGFLNRFAPGDLIFIKINCEGGEVPIIDRLCEAPIIPTIKSIAVDFDIIKTRWGYWTKRRTVRKAKVADLPIALYEDVMVKHAGGIGNWLDKFPEHFPGRNGRRHIGQPLKRKLRYASRDFRSALGLQLTWRH